MISKKYFIFICLLLVIIPVASANGDVAEGEDTSIASDWYVGTNTTIDGDGSQDNPFNNVELALNKANDNDTIYIQAGNYSGDKNNNLLISQNNLKISSTGGEAVFSGDNIFNVTGRGITIESLSFVDCRSNVINVNGQLKVFNLTFSDNFVASDVCINNNRDSQLIVDSCYFEENYAYYGDGGAITNKGTATVTNSKFINNKAYRDGGAIRNYGGIIKISDCDFIGNSAFGNNHDCWGGAIYQWIGTTEVYNCNFINNSADSKGGAIIITRGRLEIAWSNFTCVNSTFINNSAAEGGAIELEACIADVKYNSFINNTVNQVGGSTYWGYDLLNATINNNWWGKNNPDWNKTIINLDIPENNIVLKVNADSNIIGVGQIANIAYGFYTNDTNLKVNLTRDIKTNGFENNTFSSGVEGIYNLTAASDNEVFTLAMEVTNNPLKLIADNVTLYYKNGTGFVVGLVDNNNTGVAGKIISVLINGNIYTRTTDENGQASIPLNLNCGVYEVISKYGVSEVKSTVSILSTIGGSDITKIFRNGTQFYAKFIDGHGNNLANENVSFNINGVIYKRTTDNNGIAGLTINLNPSEYIITSINLINNESASNTIVVLPNIIENKDLIKYYKNGSQYSVKVLGDDATPLADATVVFNINGVLYTRITNEMGIAQLNINLPPGNYIITAEYNGYRVSNNINVLPVLKAENLYVVQGSGKVFEASLIDGEGNPLANENITFNINGVFYTRTTNGSGIAGLTINLLEGEYIITSSYNGANIANTIYCVVYQAQSQTQYYSSGSRAVSLGNNSVRRGY